MRLIPLLLLLSSCTHSIERVEKMEMSDHTDLTDSALSVLASIEGRDTVTIERVKTLEKVRVVPREVVKYVEVESSPVFSAMIRPVYSIEGRDTVYSIERCDTVYVYRVDTVYIAK